MSNDLNQCNFIGRLGKEPDARAMPSGEYVTVISIAVGETWKDKQTGQKMEQTEWVRVVAYRRLAEIFRDYLHKGSKVYISGKMKTKKWTGKDGADRYTTEIIANNMQMLDTRPQDDGRGGQAAPGGQSAGQQTPGQHTQAPPANQPQGVHQQQPANNHGGQQHDDFGDFDDDIPFS